jgi:nucleoid-associated protein YgaU
VLLSFVVLATVFFLNRPGAKSKSDEAATAESGRSAVVAAIPPAAPETVEPSPSTETTPPTPPAPASAPVASAVASQPAEDANLLPKPKTGDIQVALLDEKKPADSDVPLPAPMPVPTPVEGAVEKEKQPEPSLPAPMPAEPTKPVPSETESTPPMPVSPTTKPDDKPEATPAPDPAPMPIPAPEAAAPGPLAPAVTPEPAREDVKPVAPSPIPDPAPAPTTPLAKPDDKPEPVPAPQPESAAPKPVAPEPTPASVPMPTLPAPAPEPTAPQVAPTRADPPQLTPPPTPTEPAPEPKPLVPTPASSGPDDWETLPTAGPGRMVDITDRPSPDPLPKETRARAAEPLEREPSPVKTVAAPVAAAPRAKEPATRDEPTDEPGAGRVEAVAHVVQRGENFWTISQLYYNSGRYYKALWAANRTIVAAPDQLVVGQSLRIPPPEDLDPRLIVKLRAATKPVSAPSPTSGTTAPRRVRPALDTTEVDLPAADPFAREPRTGSTSDIDPGPGRESETRVRPKRALYRVRTNETLRSIARDTLGDSHRADEILDLNSSILKDSSDLVPGQVIELPSDAKLGVGAIDRPSRRTRTVD